MQGTSAILILSSLAVTNLLPLHSPQQEPEPPGRFDVHYDPVCPVSTHRLVVYRGPLDGSGFGQHQEFVLEQGGDLAFQVRTGVQAIGTTMDLEAPELDPLGGRSTAILDLETLAITHYPRYTSFAVAEDGTVAGVVIDAEEIQLHDSNGNSIKVAIPEVPKRLAFTAEGDLLVLTSKSLFRIDCQLGKIELTCPPKPDPTLKLELAFRRNRHGTKTAHRRTNHPQASRS